MAIYTDGVVPWNSLDNNTRVPLASELESGYPCGEADQALFNWTAGWPIGNIWNMLLQSGITPDADKLLDLSRAIQTGKINYAVASGTANSLVATLSPTPVSLTPGMRVVVLIATGNTGAATLNCNGLGPIPIQTRTGNPVKIGDLTPGASVPMVYHVSGAWRLESITYSEVPVISTSTVTLYVRTDGNDSNNGASNTSAGAFLTPLAAIKYGMSHYFMSGQTLVIKLGIPGTYAAPGQLLISGFVLRIEGDVTAQDNFILSGSTSMISVVSGNVTIAGVNVYCSVAASTTSNIGAVNSGSNVTLINVTLSGLSASSTALISCTSATITIGPGCKFSLSAVYMFYVQSGTVLINGLVTIIGNPAYTWVAFTIYLGAILAVGGSSFSGAATGQRYSANTNGVINTNGGGANFFPGSIAGAQTNGGQYV